ncbi:MAG: non-heme iron oxygenase ferredoxin subunit [Gemmatimonadota bacterium]|jgi:3-phenylpropionate/trans-cinnamate dioxygenase ferredoxin subunit|nr:non-heme iron oxygenase ferredoxin subunit [Gemmatimonadota bacterium]
MAFRNVTPLAALDEGKTLSVTVEGKDICLARLEGEVYAFANNCSHRDFPLVDGELDAGDCSITCEWHGARFDIKTGAPLSTPATRPIAVYPCRVENGQILVDPD